MKRPNREEVDAAMQEMVLVFQECELEYQRDMEMSQQPTPFRWWLLIFAAAFVLGTVPVWGTFLVCWWRS